MPFRVGLMFNLKPAEAPEDGEPPDAHAELDDEGTILAVAEALRAGGHDVVLVEGNLSALDRLREVPIDIAFNMCEGLRGPCREAQIPALLEMLGIPFTGSNALTLALTLDKPMAKKVFAYHGIPTARFLAVPLGQGVPACELRYPLFVKPAREGSSMGIGPESIVHSEVELRAQVARVHELYRQDALVEEFLQGREFTVGIVGNGRPHVFPIMEINFGAVPGGHGPVYSYQFKREWDGDEYYLCPAPAAPELAERLQATALAAYRAVGCCDVGRVDLRLDSSGVPNVMEINPIPGLRPGFSDLPRVADAGGTSYVSLINGILDAAVERYKLHPSRSVWVQSA